MTKESVVIVNGASPGLGGAVTRWLAKARATVLLQVLISFLVRLNFINLLRLAGHRRGKNAIPPMFTSAAGMWINARRQKCLIVTGWWFRPTKQLGQYDGVCSVRMALCRDTFYNQAVRGGFLR